MRDVVATHVSGGASRWLWRDFDAVVAVGVVAALVHSIHNPSAKPIDFPSAVKCQLTRDGDVREQLLAYLVLPHAILARTVPTNQPG